MDNLYTLLRAVDNSHADHLSPQQAVEILQRKKAYLQAAAKDNPLAREILNNGSVACDLLDKTGHRAFLVGPPTFFRVHELLRRTRKKNLPIQIGGKEFSHNDVVALYERCVPNVRLFHAPWCSPSRYTASLGLAWTSTLLTAHIVGRNADIPTHFDSGVLYYMGLYTSVVALLYTAFKTNRDVRHAAPWNTALYLDLNVDLVRRDQPSAAVATKDVLPRQTGLFKTPDFYHPLARKIETHGFDSDLTARLAGQPSAPAKTQKS
jgi:hypothetical protein